MWKILVAFGVALLIDWRVSRRNSPTHQARIYHPNLRIWGLGLIAGIAIIVLSFFGDAVRTHVTCPAPSGSTWFTFVPLFVLTAAVGFIVWAIVGLCTSE
ncbi:MAG TPA: hypothetical protein VFB65_02935 [Pyrinomonadaceae bacterium]|nr:hypothetical protein [Pyrinomonadaceae bacterium]